MNKQQRDYLDEIFLLTKPPATELATNRIAELVGLINGEDEITEVVDSIDAEMRGRVYVLRMLFQSRKLYDVMVGAPEYLSVLDNPALQKILLNARPSGLMDHIDARIKADMDKLREAMAVANDSKAWHDRYHALAHEHNNVLDKLARMDEMESKLRILIEVADAATLRAYIDAMEKHNA